MKKGNSYTKLIFKNVFILSFSLIAFSCNQQKDVWRGTIKYKDGIKHIQNKTPSWGEKPQIKLEFVQKLGELESDDGSYLFNKPWDVAEDSEGNIYIVDLGDSCIKKFSPTSIHLLTFGRQGQGPGELGQCRHIEIDKNDTIYIKDYMFDRIQVFNADGEFKKTIPNLKFGKSRIFDSNKLLVWGYNYNLAKQKATTMVIKSFNDEILTEFSKAETYTLADKEMEMYVSVGGNSLEFTTDEEDNIYLAYRSQNRIEKFDKNSRLLFKANRVLGFKTGYEMKTEFGDIARTIKVTIPKFKKVSIAIQIDHKNRIWILAHKSHADDPDQAEAVDLFELEIYSNDGILLGRLPYPVEWEAGWTALMKIFGNRVYFINSMTSPEIYQYQIIDL